MPVGLLPLVKTSMTMELQHALFVINEDKESVAFPAGESPYDGNLYAQRRRNLGHVTFNRQ
jgi:hypothetical protein